MARGEGTEREAEIEAALAQHSAGSSPGFLLWHASLRWQRVVSAALSGVGLTHVQFLVLASTWWLDRTRTPSQREIAEHAGLDQVMTSTVVRALVREGLLVRSREERDARVMRIRPTPRGKRLAQRSVVIMDRTDAAFFSAPGDVPGSVDALVDSLRFLAARDLGGRAIGHPAAPAVAGNAAS